MDNLEERINQGNILNDIKSSDQHIWKVSFKNRYFKWCTIVTQNGLILLFNYVDDEYKEISDDEPIGKKANNYFKRFFDEHCLIEKIK